ncbi:peptidylprolyl isomerase FKBP-type [Desulfovibrio sp. X2]|uniref:FKBP-type peptidyl-prolyl cis-trans isomerase n=1 Tax=Desulfovibrio sp. X2 TaxID=941449 RepID=UPI0003587D98|nr:peptidylprolyl isomerase [Desulfovibrio sp. X2]EPR38710.1 peptidylprolyl isomerase FKBP-type [Desulfovibrio sp. X2]
MAQAKNGDVVKVHYTGKLSDGTVFDSSEGRDPLEFTLGEGMVIEGFEKAVVGLAPGEKREATFGPDEAYGSYDESLSCAVPRDQIPEHIQPEVGMMLSFTTEDGQPAHVTVTEVTDDSVTLDGNHPLAGKTLTFAVELVSIG